MVSALRSQLCWIRRSRWKSMILVSKQTAQHQRDWRCVALYLSNDIIQSDLKERSEGIVSHLHTHTLRASHLHTHTLWARDRQRQTLAKWKVMLCPVFVLSITAEGCQESAEIKVNNSDKCVCVWRVALIAADATITHSLFPHTHTPAGNHIHIHWIYITLMSLCAFTLMTHISWFTINRFCVL